MAKHSANLARIPIKWVRDKAKAKYEKGTECEICGSVENLDFHHYYTLTPLFERWCKLNKLVMRTDDDVKLVRDEFIEKHHDELYVHAVTLCHEHHMKLHSIYGKDPALATADKQKAWVGKQREKYEARKLAD